MSFVYIAARYGIPAGCKGSVKKSVKGKIRDGSQRCLQKEGNRMLRMERKPGRYLSE